MTGRGGMPGIEPRDDIHDIADTPQALFSAYEVHRERTSRPSMKWHFKTLLPHAFNSYVHLWELVQ